METAVEAVIRETQEEINIRLEKSDLFRHGDLSFEFPSKPDWGMLVTVFSSRNWQGEPTESEEMKPEWFLTTSLPYDQMWWDDKIWLPKLIDGKRFSGKFVFGDDEKTIISQEFKEIA
jgi:8-oxo-dGTP pyrophosphatase MutT (NUDIX family)